MFVLPINCRRHFPILGLRQQRGAQDQRIRPIGFLPVDGRSSAGAAEVAVDRFARVSGVDVLLDLLFALGVGKGRHGDDLVEGEGGVAEDFAGVTVALSLRRGGDEWSACIWHWSRGIL